jgi:DNA-binding GntR family transcriptional regulator
MFYARTVEGAAHHMTVPFNTVLEGGDDALRSTGSHPIERHSLVDIAAMRVRHEIVHGQHAPGEVLTEIALSSRLGVGRGTIRAALFALEADELVVRAPYSNWSVAPLNPEAIWEIYTLRGALEGLAARIVAERRLPAATTHLQDALERVRIAETQSANERVIADLSLHRTMVDVTGHRSLMRRYLALSAKMEWLYRWSEVHRPNREPLFGAHAPLVDALLHGTPQQAEDAVRAHIAASLDDDLNGYAAINAGHPA